ncbi:IMPACT family protein [Sungkyunkwania multivorans]|uniref:IMPACT family protein n=1 Tax=Sungkyunkwania multivorans TaxID=1173618 RepID=A0ABW3CX37_9FLAO
MNDTYKTIAASSEEVLYKDRNSKFFAYAFPVKTEEAIKEHIETLKKQHHNARHWCYAWQLGTSQLHFRANDDGEPNNSAGQPIYRQIQSFDLTDILVVVVRYFGGTKLGVGGLINAYGTAAQMSLEAAEIVEKTINEVFYISFDYKDINSVMRIIKELQIEIEEQKMEMKCQMTLSVRKSDMKRTMAAFKNLYEVVVTKTEI